MRRSRRVSPYPWNNTSDIPLAFPGVIAVVVVIEDEYDYDNDNDNDNGQKR